MPDSDGSANVQLLGQTQSEAAMSIRAGATLGNSGAIDAGAGIEVIAGNILNAGSIVQRNAEGALLKAAGRFDNSGGIQSGGALNIAAAGITDSNGSLQAAGALRLDALGLTLAGTNMVSGGDIALLATGGDIAAKNSVVKTNGGLLAHAAGAADLATSNWQALSQVDLSAKTVSSRDALLQANGDLHVSSTGAIDNAAGRLLAGGRLTLGAGVLLNAGGRIAANADLAVHTEAGIGNRAGTLSAAGSLDIAAPNGGLDNTAGTLVAGDRIGIVSGRLVNDGGTIAALSAQGGVLGLHAASMSNQRGAISAGGSLALASAGEVNNSGGTIAAGAAANISTGPASLINDGGHIVARDALDVSTGALHNDAVGAAGAIIASSAGATRIDAGQISNVGGLVTATAAERATPFLNGNPDGSFTPEQQARFGSSKPGQQASVAVTRAMQYVGQPCSDCRSKVAAIDDAVTKLQEARLLYQDDAGSVKLIDQQIDQLKAGITKDELARGMAGVISDKDKGIAALVLGTPSQVVAGTATSELLERTALSQTIKDIRAALPSSVLRNKGNVAAANIDIPGLPSQMVASSRVDVPSYGLVGNGGQNFIYTKLPSADGGMISRNADSEYKILDNVADQLGKNNNASGSITIVTERPACESCLNVVNQFRARYPNIEVKVFDNNGLMLIPPK